MKSRTTHNRRVLTGYHSRVGTRSGAIMTLVLVLGFIGAFCMASGIGIANAASPCEKSAKATLKSCKFAAKDGFWLSSAKCENLPTPEARNECKNEAREEMKEETGDCKDQKKARTEICKELGGDAYHPIINPADFVDQIDNPFLPLTPGITFTYKAGMEDIVVHVTHETKEILGVTCVVVRDTVTVGGELVEDTLDWFAQDKDGNVWYFGEESKEYENGELVSLEGSWKAGVDGAQPGIIMKANPQVGDLYRQEFAPGEAEDMGEVLSLNESVTVPFGTFDNCLMTRDFSPLEPDVEEHKYYAPGVGVVLEVNVETGERVELVGIATQ